MTEYGPLAAALAKAQASFPAISRDKEVTVKLKTGGEYKFKYAPLDSILAAVRGPLAANGLAIVQLLDEDVLVTSLLHESGAILSGRTPIPASEGVQAYGSAITYLRRYSIQALLGIAAEEDDDGNHAAGNQATFAKPSRQVRAPATGPKQETVSPDTTLEPMGAWLGTGALGIGGVGFDGRARSGPDGTIFGFRFDTIDDKTIPQVLVEGTFAQDLADALGNEVKGTLATISGDLFRVNWYKNGQDKPPIQFQRLILKSIQTAAWTLPAPGQTGPGLFDAEAESELDGLLK